MRRQNESGRRNLRPLYSKFQLFSAIWRGDRKGTALLGSKKEENPSQLTWETDFWNVAQLWIVHRLARKRKIFAILTSQHPLARIWTRLNFDYTSSLLQNINVFSRITIVDGKGSREVKSRDLQKDTYRTPTKCTYLILASLLNLEGSYDARNELEDEKKRPKNHFFEAVRGWNGA